MDLQFLRFGIYKIACKSVKSIKEKHKMKTLNQIPGRPATPAQPATLCSWPGQRGPLGLHGPWRPPAHAHTLTRRAHQPESQRAGEAEVTVKLVAGEPVGEAEATILLPTRICTGWCTMGFIGLAERARCRRWRVQRCRAGCAGQLWPRWPDLRLAWASRGPRQLAMLVRRGRGRHQRGWSWWARAGRSFRRGSRGGGVRNRALPRLSSLREEDVDVEGLKAVVMWWRACMCTLEQRRQWRLGFFASPWREKERGRGGSAGECGVVVL
jgi:hypothetical protein